MCVMLKVAYRGWVVGGGGVMLKVAYSVCDVKSSLQVCVCVCDVNSTLQCIC